MTRLIDWEARLAAVEEQLARRRWRWGRHDCVSAAAEVVRAITGADVEIPRVRSRNEFRRLYGEEYAQILIATAFDVVAARLGLRRIDASYAQRGDVVLISGGTVGWVSSTGYPAAAAPRGLVQLVGFGDVVAAWRV